MADKYFNSDTENKGSSQQNPNLVYYEEVSGATSGITYLAQLVKIRGAGVSLSTGDINVELSHSTDSVKIGDGTDLWGINADGSGKISGSTILYDSGGTRSANILTNNALKISGSTQISDGTNVVNVLTNNALKISGSTQISDGTNFAAINPDNSLKISGSTVIYDSGGTRSANILTNNALKISGSTQISDGTNNVSISGNSLQVLITDNESHIGQMGGHSKKPQIKIIRAGNSTIYSVLDSINSGGTVMERFNVARSNNKTSILFGGSMTSSISAATALSCTLHIYSSGISVSSDNTLWQPNVNELDHHLGYIDFSTWKVLGNRSVSAGIIENPFILTPDPDNPSSVWGVLIARNAYVPGSGEILTASLDISQD